MLTIRGKDVSHLITVLQVGGRGPASQELTRKSIAERPGSYLQSIRVPERIIPVRFLLVGKDMYELRTNIDELNQLLYPDDLTDDERRWGYSIVSSDEPNMTYYGLPDGEPNWAEITEKGIGEISFVCFDPHKYGSEQTQILTNVDQTVVYNGGGRETYPIITATILEPTTFFAVYSPTQSLELGAPITIDTTPLEKEQKVVNDNCSSVSEWANGDSVDGGVVAGQMMSTGEVFKAQSFGTGTYSYWHGPAKKIGLPTPIQDFKVNVNVSLISPTVQSLGRVEIYLLDINNNVIGKMALKDLSAVINKTDAEVRVGDLNSGTYIVNEPKRQWTEFRGGLLSFERIGNKFKAYIAQTYIEGWHFGTHTATFTDVDLEHQAELAQIQVHVGGRAGYDRSNLAIHHVEVYKINQDTEVQIPYIAEAGDVITIDHNKKEILKNGQDFRWAKNLSSTLFPLKRGENTLAFYPQNVADVEVKWRERWL